MEMNEKITTHSVNPWIIFIYVTIGTFMVNIDSSIINVALPTLQKTFHVSIEQVQWVIVAYLLLITGILPFIGSLSDQKGRKRFFLFGIVIFIIGSTLSALAFNLLFLIVSRCIQAVGAAMIMGNVMGIVANIFQRGNRGKALGMIGAVVAAGTIIGPSLGGFFISQFGWRSIFLINIPLGIISILGSIFFLPSFDSEKKQKLQFDLSGALLFFLAMSTLLFFISNEKTIGWSSLGGLSLLIISVLAWIIFVRREKSADNPMINLKFFKNRQFTIGIIATFFYYFLMMSTYVLLPLYLSHVLKFPVFYIGLLMTPQAIVMIIASPLSGWLADKIGTLIPALIGMVIIALDLLLISQFDSTTTPHQIVVVMLILGIGFSLFASPNNVSVIESLPPSQSGIAGSLIATIRNFGQVTGTAVGILLLNIGLSKYSGDYVQAVNLSFIVNVMIALLTIIILAMQFKIKSKSRVEKQK